MTLNASQEPWLMISMGSVWGFLEDWGYVVVAVGIMLYYLIDTYKPVLYIQRYFDKIANSGRNKHVDVINEDLRSIRQQQQIKTALDAKEKAKKKEEEDLERKAQYDPTKDVQSQVKDRKKPTINPLFAHGGGGMSSYKPNVQSRYKSSGRGG
eukprot:GFYU01000480.1.p1 GENE.GFYU01000480.1~~GFYU01000480.1.p1  ORF type:complete len:153 (+),score=53.74 GFYU01000480.1:36-494(+)